MLHIIVDISNMEIHSAVEVTEWVVTEVIVTCSSSLRRSIICNRFIYASLAPLAVSHRWCFVTL